MRWLALVCSLCAVTAGCGAARTAASPPVPTHREIVCDAAIAYRSLAQIADHATATVVLRATGRQRVLAVGGTPFTLAGVAVLRTLAGRPVPGSVQLRETGGPGIAVAGCGPRVAAGHTYLAFLVPFRRRVHGAPVGDQYFLVGPAVYELAGGSPLSPAARFRRVGPASVAGLPAQVTARELTRR